MHASYKILKNNPLIKEKMDIIFHTITQDADR
jgi:hypothetical protein